MNNRREDDMINLSSKTEVEEFAKVLGCTAKCVQYCASQVGPSKNAIRFFWSMNRDRIRKQQESEHC